MRGSPPPSKPIRPAREHAQTGRYPPRAIAWDCPHHREGERSGHARTYAGQAHQNRPVTPHMSTDADMSLEAMGQLSRRRANRVRTARDPLGDKGFHEHPSASVHPGTLPQRQQVTPPPEDAPSTAKASPPGRTRARPHQPTPESAHHSLHTQGAAHEFSCAAPFCLSRNPTASIGHPESVRLPTPTSAVGPRHRTRSACRRSSARPSPWPPNASGSTNGHRP